MRQRVTGLHLPGALQGDRGAASRVTRRPKAPRTNGGPWHVVQLRVYFLGDPPQKTEKTTKKSVPFGFPSNPQTNGCPQEKTCCFEGTPIAALTHIGQVPTHVNCRILKGFRIWFPPSLGEQFRTKQSHGLLGLHVSCRGNQNAPPALPNQGSSKGKAWNHKGSWYTLTWAGGTLKYVVSGVLFGFPLNQPQRRVSSKASLAKTANKPESLTSGLAGFRTRRRLGIP